MVCYLCHWEVESNLFLLNRTVLIFPTWPPSLPTHIDSDAFCAPGKTLPVSRFHLSSPWPGVELVVFTRVPWKEQKRTPPPVLLFRLMWVFMRGHTGPQVKWTLRRTKPSPQHSGESCTAAPAVDLAFLLHCCRSQWHAAIQPLCTHTPSAHTRQQHNSFMCFLTTSHQWQLDLFDLSRFP